MSRKSTTINKKRFLELFPNCDFNITKTCKEVGITPKTYYRWVDEETGDEEFIYDLKVVEQQEVHHVKSKLRQLIDGFEHEMEREKVDKEGNVIPYKARFYFPPNFQAIKLFLEAHARHLGYGMKPDDSNANLYD